MADLIAGRTMADIFSSFVNPIASNPLMQNQGQPGLTPAMNALLQKPIPYDDGINPAYKAFLAMASKPESLLDNQGDSPGLIERIIGFLFGRHVGMQMRTDSSGIPVDSAGKPLGGFVVNMPSPRTAWDKLEAMKGQHEMLRAEGGIGLKRLDYATEGADGKLNVTPGAPLTDEEQKTWEQRQWDHGITRPWDQTGGTPYGRAIRRMVPGLPLGAYPPDPNDPNDPRNDPRNRQPPAQP